MAAGRKTGGRVKGVPNKTTADVKQAAQAFTSAAIETLASIMREVEQPAAARVAAANALLDRGHGKPKQSVDLEADIKAQITGIERRIVDPADRNA